MFPHPQSTLYVLRRVKVVVSYPSAFLTASLANSSKPSQGKLLFYQSISCKSINVLFLLENHALFFTGKHGVQRNDSEPASSDRVKWGCENVISPIIVIGLKHRDFFILHWDWSNVCGGGMAEWFKTTLDLESGDPWFKSCTLSLSDLCSVPNSTPWPGCVNSQLFSLPPVGILNSLCSIWNICLLNYSVTN